ncbi:MAG: mechanosensitive ion channel family protein [Bradymonadaceae bacterium]
MEETQVEEQLTTSAEIAADAASLAARWSETVPWLAWVEDYPIAITGAGILFLLVVIWISKAIAGRYILKAIVRFAEKSAITWDDTLVQEKVFHRLVPVVPVLALHWGILFIPGLPAEVVHFVQIIAMCSIIVLMARSLSAFLTAVNIIYQRHPVAVGRPIKGYLQVLQVLTYLVAGILVISLLMDKSPLFFLSGLGAMTAVLLLIFRDTLLSLVAGIQLTSNDLIRVGDWIEMPNFSADGDVVDIALNVVTVQNWDRTLTVIPTHKFLEHSFRNWRGMFESGGRRIMRSIHLDLSTVRFLTPEEIEKFRRYVVLRDYIEAKVEEIENYNTELIPAEYADVMANQRALTNVGTFRAYITNYLKAHPNINNDLILLIRQLEATPQGLPIQIYAFTNDTRWVYYEGIQGDLFDHLLAILPEFGLRVYQQPAGTDLTGLVGPAKSDQPPGVSLPIPKEGEVPA